MDGRSEVNPDHNKRTADHTKKNKSSKNTVRCLMISCKGKPNRDGRAKRSQSLLLIKKTTNQKRNNHLQYIHKTIFISQPLKFNFGGCFFWPLKNNFVLHLSILFRRFSRNTLEVFAKDRLRGEIEVVAYLLDCHICWEKQGFNLRYHIVFNNIRSRSAWHLFDDLR